MQIQIYISVAVLILIQKSTSEAVSLSSPANVSIQCDSYGVEVQWEYPDLDQDVYFQVEVKDDFNERNSNLTQNLRLNISSMVFKAAYNRYCVTVTAVRGGEKSKTSLSDTFSYNKYSAANIKCYLDFPEVELSPKNSKLHVQFTNPLQLYRNSPAVRDLTDDLEYCIETEEGKNKTCETCERKQNTCETSVVFSEHRGKYCVNLTGNIGQRFFNLRRSCFTGDIRSYPPATLYVYPVLGVILTLLFITIIIMLSAKKCNSEMKKKVHSMFLHFFVFDQTTAAKCKTLNVPQDKVVLHLEIEPAENDKERAMLILSCDTRMCKDLGSSDSEGESPYGGNDLVEGEQSNLSGVYDCPHAPEQKEEMKSWRYSRWLWT